MDFAKLEEKLKNAGVPEETAHRYVVFYERGLMPELSFENDEIPSDECFKTLSAVCDILLKKSPESLTKFLIKNVLDIPYSQVDTVRSIIENFFSNRKEDIACLYKEKEGMYYLSADETKYLCELIEGYIADKDRAWQVFVKAVAVGLYHTERCIEAVVDAVGEQRAPEVIYEATVNGWLLHPYYTDPVEAIKYLMTMFDGEKIFKVILENPEYLYLYKEDGFIEFPEHKEKRMKEIQNIIEKYK